MLILYKQTPKEHIRQTMLFVREKYMKKTWRPCRGKIFRMEVKLFIHRVGV